MINLNQQTVKLFGVLHGPRILDVRLRKAIGHIEKMENQSVLGRTEADIINEALKSYRVEAPIFQLDGDIETIDQKVIPQHLKMRAYQKDGTAKSYFFLYTIKFTGSAEMTRSEFERNLIKYDVYYNGENNQISYLFFISTMDTALYNREKATFENHILTQQSKISEAVSRFNTDLLSGVTEAVRKRISHAEQERQFFNEINVRVSSEGQKISAEIQIHKSFTPLQAVSSSPSKLEADPQLSADIYKHILETVYNFFVSVERKPSIYKRIKDEEHLRDYIIPTLEAIYENTSVTGETFNKEGKTDILIKYKSGNLFIAECKYWKGTVILNDTIDQLFRYLTWRDTKAAIIFFVKQKGLSRIVEQLRSDIAKHHCFKSILNQSHPTRTSTIFVHKDDSRKQVYIEFMLFHYPDSIENQL